MWASNRNIARSLKREKGSTTQVRIGLLVHGKGPSDSLWYCIGMSILQMETGGDRADWWPNVKESNF